MVAWLIWSKQICATVAHIRSILGHTLLHTHCFTLIRIWREFHQFLRTQQHVEALIVFPIIFSRFMYNQVKELADEETTTSLHEYIQHLKMKLHIKKRQVKECSVGVCLWVSAKMNGMEFSLPAFLAYNSCTFVYHPSQVFNAVILSSKINSLAAGCCL